MAKDKPFNNPFGALKGKAKEPKPEKPQPAASAKKATPAAKPRQEASSDDESALFLSAMGAFDEVKPVREPLPPAQVAAQKERATADDVESLLQLAELVQGDAELVVQQTPASVSAHAEGFDARLLGRLPPAAVLDVQALLASAARQALERFIVDSQLKGLRSVRVLTGTGLRALAIESLTRGKLVRKVLAFSGGAEALDVLLRR